MESVPRIPPDQLARIARQIRANPAAAPGLTAALSLEQHIALAQMIDAAAVVEQDEKEQREIAERRAYRRRRPLRRHAPPRQSAWPLFVWLLVTATLLYFAKLPLLVIAAVVGILIAWTRFALRFPLAAIAIVGFCKGLFGGRR